MSQYVVRNDEKFRVLVGWDPPLQTFFVQVHDLTKDEEEQIILWEGTRPGEITTPRVVAAKIKDWVRLPEKTVHALYNDEDSNT